MNIIKSISVFSVVALLASAAPVYAKGGPGGMPSGGMQSGGMQGSGMQDRDRIHQIDQDADRDRDMDQDRIRDRMNSEDGTGQKIYGDKLMTEEERYEYRERIKAAKSQEERQQIREEHRHEIQVRAKEQGVELPN